MSKFNDYDYANKYADVLKDIDDMAKEVPAVRVLSKNFESPMFKVLKKITNLRNQNRWAVRSYRVDCSVLGHSFDTGVFAYLISLYTGKDEKAAAKIFFEGIWHDVPETWTKDIPSPTKDAYSGFREASEEFEIECLQKYLYNAFEYDYLRNSIKSIMLEEAENKENKKLLKNADYLSADSECWRQLVAGSNDRYFRDKVLLGDLDKITQDPDTYITGIFRELLDYYVSETKQLHLIGSIV
jgi:5'-deoxynucleotidase YfbR-like HD superfamily hydrolase